MKISRTLTLVCMVAFAVMVFSLSAAAFEPVPVPNKSEAAKAVKSIPTVQVSTNETAKAVITINILSLSRGVQPEYLAFDPLVNKELPKVVNTIGRISPAHGPPISVDKRAAGASKRTIERYTQTATVLLL